MYDFYVIVRFDTGHKAEWKFKATDFGHAEEQAKPYIEKGSEIIEIAKDYT